MEASCYECEVLGVALVRQGMLAANSRGPPGPVTSFTSELREMTTALVNTWLPPKRQ